MCFFMNEEDESALSPFAPPSGTDTLERLLKGTKLTVSNCWGLPATAAIRAVLYSAVLNLFISN